MARKRVSRNQGKTWYTQNGYITVRARLLPLGVVREFEAARASLRLSGNKAGEMLASLPNAADLMAEGKPGLDPKSVHAVRVNVPEKSIAPLWRQVGSPGRDKGLVLSCVLCALRGRIRETLLASLSGS